MKAKFQEIEMEIIEFEALDIIVCSGTDENEGEEQPMDQ